MRRVLRAAAIFVITAAGMACGAEAPTGLSVKYPRDAGIEADPAVLFTENFESGDLTKWQEKKGPVALTRDQPHAGKACLAIPMTRGKDTGGHLVKWFMPGAETVHVRFYVKFSKDYQYSHHFVWLLANPSKERWRAFGTAPTSRPGWSPRSPGARIRRPAKCACTLTIRTWRSTRR